MGSCGSEADRRSDQLHKDSNDFQLIFSYHSRDIHAYGRQGLMITPRRRLVLAMGYEGERKQCDLSRENCTPVSILIAVQHAYFIVRFMLISMLPIRTKLARVVERSSVADADIQGLSVALTATVASELAGIEDISANL